jgi:hypothetical protein
MISFGTTQVVGTCTATACQAVSPLGSGTVDVEAILDGNTSANVAADRFTYSGSSVPRGWTQWQQPLSFTGSEVMTYDAVRKQTLYVSGQFDDSGNSLADQTWTWDSVSLVWTQRFPASSPNVHMASLAFDENRGVAVLFGGVWFSTRTTGTGIVPHIGTSTWTWDGNNWTLATPAEHPTARVYASIAYDPIRGRVVLFGGCSDTGCTTVLQDTWTWDGVNWKQESPLFFPTPRSQASMTFDPTLGKVVLFGGRSNSDPTGLGDMYAWDGGNWTQLHPLNVPLARYGAGFAYSRVDSGLLLYGGTGLTGYLPETWLWNGITWTQLNPVPNPAVAFLISGMVYNLALDADVLILDGQIWTWGGKP